MKKEPYVALVASVIKWSVIDNQICTKDILFFMFHCLSFPALSISAAKYSIFLAESHMFFF